MKPTQPSRPPSTVRRGLIALASVLTLGAAGCAGHLQNQPPLGSGPVDFSGPRTSLERQTRQWQGEGPNAKLRWRATVLEVDGRRVAPDAEVLILPAGRHTLTLRCHFPYAQGRSLASTDEPNASPEDSQSVTAELNFLLQEGEHYYPHGVYVPPSGRDQSLTPCQTALRTEPPPLMASR